MENDRVGRFLGTQCIYTQSYSISHCLRRHERCGKVASRWSGTWPGACWYGRCSAGWSTRCRSLWHRRVCSSRNWLGPRHRPRRWWPIIHTTQHYHCHAILSKKSTAITHAVITNTHCRQKESGKLISFRSRGTQKNSKCKPQAPNVVMQLQWNKPVLNNVTNFHSVQLQFC